jgi:hypothetical protein
MDAHTSIWIITTINHNTVTKQRETVFVVLYRRYVCTYGTIHIIYSTYFSSLTTPRRPMPQDKHDGAIAWADATEKQSQHLLHAEEISK